MHFQKLNIRFALSAAQEGGDEEGAKSTPWLSKLDICQQIQQVKGMSGGYTAAKFWKLYSLSLPTFPKKRTCGSLFLGEVLGLECPASSLFTLGVQSSPV